MAKSLIVGHTHQMVELFHPGQWHDFFVMIGGGSAALTGLVFVAMSLNPNVITQDPTHLYRAIGTLAGLSAVFVTCALALMGGQGHISIGIEWLVISVVAAGIFTRGYVQAIRRGGSSVGLGLTRRVVGAVLYAVEIIGAVLFLAGTIVGLYMVAISAVLLLVYMITGAWLLIVGVSTITTDSAGKV
jgi:modulator of FtsH protease